MPFAGYGGDEDRAAFYGHTTRHYCTALKAGELLEWSTGEAVIEPAVKTLVQALDLSLTRGKRTTLILLILWRR
jgi:hypothetical protein